MTGWNVGCDYANTIGSYPTQTVALYTMDQDPYCISYQQSGLRAVLPPEPTLVTFGFREKYTQS